MSGAPWWPSLQDSLSCAWARTDVRCSILAASLHFILLQRARTLPERAAELLPVCCEVALVAAVLLGSRRLWLRLRTPLVVAIRICVLLVIPWTVDLVGAYMHPVRAAAAAAGGSGGGNGGGAWAAVTRWVDVCFSA